MNDATAPLTAETLVCPECHWNSNAGEPIRDPYGHGIVTCPECHAADRMVEVKFHDPDPVKSDIPELDVCNMCGRISSAPSIQADKYHARWTLCDACRPDAAIRAELQRAKTRFPDWPTDPIHAFAIVAEEFGEAAREILQMTYEPDRSTLERVRTETVQLAAMCHRFLESLERYEFRPCGQHRQ